MLRKTLTILSFIGLLLSVGLWGAGYFQIGYVSPAGKLIVFPYRGCFLLVADWQDDSAGTIYRRSYVDFLRDRRLNHWVFYGFKYRGVPRIRLSRGATMPPDVEGKLWVETALPGFELFIPLFVPLILSLVYPAYLLLPSVRRNRRKGLGLCVKCGYDLRGSKDRCPECGTGFSDC